MPQREEPFAYNFADDFLGGVNSYFPANKLGQNFMTQAQNAWVNENGILTRRPGITQVGTVSAIPAGTADRILSMEVGGAGDQKKLYMLRKNTSGQAYLESWDGSNWLTSQAAFGATFTNIADMTWARDSGGTEYMYMTSDSSSAGVYRATITNSAVAPTVSAWPSDTNTDPQKGMTTIFLHDQWIFGTGVWLTNREKIYYSSNWPYIEVWDRTQFFVAVGTLQGQRVVTAAPYQERSLFIGMEGSTFLLQLGRESIGLDSSLITVSSDIGAGAFKTTAVEQDLFFFTQERDIRSLTRTLQDRGTGVRSVPISLPITDKMEGIAKDVLILSTMAFHNGRVWVSFPTASNLNTWELWVFDISLQRWFGPMVLKDSSGTQLNVQALAKTASNPGDSSIASGDNKLYFATDDVTGGTSRFQVYELDDTVFQDAGSTNIDMDVITRASDLESPHRTKHFRYGKITYLKVTGTTGSFKLSARVDFGPWHLMGVFFYTSGDEIITQEFDMRRLPRGELLQFRVECSDTNTHPEIERLIVTGHILPLR
jgi:hypothetical protein